MHTYNNALLIAEKVSLRNTIKSVYLKHRSEFDINITFMAQAGHLVTLKMPDEIDPEQKKWNYDVLPFHPEEHGGFSYNVIPRVANLYNDIKKEIKSGKYDCIIHAGDPDQEGELLINLVLQQIGNTLPVLRYWSNAQDETSVINALHNMQDDSQIKFKRFYNAALSRQKADYRIGMNISKVCTIKYGDRVAVGRVKTLLTSMIVERDLAIENFKPSTSYEIRADYVKDFSGIYFIKGEKSDGSSEDTSVYRFPTKKEAEDFIKTLSNKAKVIDVQKTTAKAYAPQLFKLATLQSAASTAYGYDINQTAEICQSLYEKHITTYPRSDCPYLNGLEDFGNMLKISEKFSDLEPYAKKITAATISLFLAEEQKKSKPKYINKAEFDKAGHSALVPTGQPFDISSLTTEEKNILYLICRQFVAIFQPPAIQNKVVIIAENNGNLFRSTGKSIVDKGYTELFKIKTTDTILPDGIKKGEILDVKTHIPVEKTTTCPRPYSDTELVNIMNNPVRLLREKGIKTISDTLEIGTAASRGPIIETLINTDKYIYKEQKGKTKYYRSTKLGREIISRMKDLDLCNISITASWDQKLTAIRNGTYDSIIFDSEIIEYVNKLINDIKDSSATTLPSAREKTGGAVAICDCPNCANGKILESTKGYFCSEYKTGCNLGIWKEFMKSKITAANVRTLCTGKTIKKDITSSSGKTWKQELIYDKGKRKIEFAKK